MNFSGLSLEQAPPISAPLRFFLTAPLFGIVAAGLLFFVDADTLMNRYSSEAILFVHLITLGVFAMVMLGAMQQMLPVLAGVTLPYDLKVAWSSHLSLVIGILAFFYGFVSMDVTAKVVAMTALGLGFIILLGAITMALVKVKNFNATVRSMSAATAIAIIIVTLGSYLLGAHVTQNISALHYSLVNIHATLAIFGFGGLLVIGVSFQVLPMFYVAPRFKGFCKKYVLWLILSGLILWVVFTLLYPPASFIGKGVIALFFLAFATTVLKKLRQRRRPVSDVTIWYWKTAALSLVIGLAIWVANDVVGIDLISFVAIFIGGGFLVSLITGMLYKIVPFLVWFHLNASGYIEIPTMKEMINEPIAKVQYLLFVLALLLGVISFFYPFTLTFAATALLFSFILLEYNLIKVVLVYRKIKKRTPDFVMPSVQTH